MPPLYADATRRGDPAGALRAADQLADGGLDNVQLLGGAAEMPRFGDGEEVAHLPEFHGRRPFREINNGS